LIADECHIFVMFIFAYQAQFRTMAVA